MHRRAGQMPVDGLEMIEPGDQLVELGTGFGLLDALLQFADVKEIFRYGIRIFTAGPLLWRLLILLCGIR